jgi:hypothetical protein
MGRAGGDVGEVEVVEAGVCHVEGVVEEASEGVGQLLAVTWVGDEGRRT